MPEFITQHERNPDLHADKDDAALEALLESFDPSRPEDLAVPEPAPAEATPVEEVPPPPVEAAPAEPEPEPEPEPEIDLKSLERDLDKAERDELKAKYESLQLHASRMAGEVGFLRKKLEAVPSASEPYEPQTQQELDRLSLLEQRLAQSEAERLRSTVSQAVQQEMLKMDGPWVTEYEKELAPLLPDLRAKIEDAMSIQDPELARRTAGSYIAAAKAEATKAHVQERYRVAQERKATTAPKLAKAKQAASVSGSGSVPAPTPQPKSYKDMTADEADAWLRENVL